MIYRLSLLLLLSVCTLGLIRCGERFCPTCLPFNEFITPETSIEQQMVDIALSKDRSKVDELEMLYKSANSKNSTLLFLQALRPVGNHNYYFNYGYNVNNAVEIISQTGMELMLIYGNASDQDYLIKVSAMAKNPERKQLILTLSNYIPLNDKLLESVEGLYYNFHGVNIYEWFSSQKAEETEFAYSFFSKFTTYSPAIWTIMFDGLKHHNPNIRMWSASYFRFNHRMNSIYARQFKEIWTSEPEHFVKQVLVMTIKENRLLYSPSELDWIIKEFASSSDLKIAGMVSDITK